MTIAPAAASPAASPLTPLGPAAPMPMPSTRGGGIRTQTPSEMSRLMTRQAGKARKVLQQTRRKAYGRG